MMTAFEREDLANLQRNGAFVQVDSRMQNISMCVRGIRRTNDQANMLGTRLPPDTLQKRRKSGGFVHALKERQQQISFISAGKCHTLPYGRFAEMSRVYDPSNDQQLAEDHVYIPDPS